MSFALYALLTSESPEVTPQSLKATVDHYFRNSRQFSSRLVPKPFSRDQSLRLEWDRWSVILTPEQGEHVKAESAEIRKRLGSKAPAGLQLLDRRVYAFFADDPDKLYTTQAVDVMQFLKEIEGSIVFDIKQNDILNHKRER